MFNLSKWLVAGIIDGYRNGHTPFVKVTEMTASYLGKGFISEEQAEEIAMACPVPEVPKDTEDTKETEDEAG